MFPMNVVCALGGAKITSFLTFTPNTWINIPTFFSNSPGTLVRIDVITQSSVFIPGSMSLYGQQSGTGNRDLFGQNGDTPRRNGTTLDSISGFVLIQDVAYNYEWHADGTVGRWSMSGLSGGARTQSNVSGTTSMQIGANASGGGWEGRISGFRIYENETDLIHHWPIDEEVEDGGIIPDIVGNDDGILILGNGFWTEFTVEDFVVNVGALGQLFGFEATVYGTISNDNLDGETITGMYIDGVQGDAPTLRLSAKSAFEQYSWSDSSDDFATVIILDNVSGGTYTSPADTIRKVAWENSVGQNITVRIEHVS